MISTQVTYPINLRPTTTNKMWLARTPGIHLSGVLRRCAQSAKILDYDDGPTLDEIISSTPLDQVGRSGILMRILLGYAWEDYMAKHITASVPGFIPQPGELTLDGIIGTPDGVVIEPDFSMVMHSFKWTFASSNTPITDKQMWLWQEGCYLKMASALVGVFCNTAVYHVCHVRGNYKGIDPQYIATRVEFAPAEIEGYWNMVQRNKHLAVPEKGQGQTGKENENGN